MALTRNFGWVHPATVGRIHYGASRAPAGALDAIPRAVRLGDVPTDVYNQGSVGSCVSQALACATRIVLARDGYANDQPSRPDIYFRGRKREGTTGVDAGLLVADGVDALRDGWMNESKWPHEETWGAKWTNEPPALHADAPRVVSAEALAITVEDIAWEIASGHPVVIGLLITEAWESLSGDTLPDVEGQAIGGHAVCVVGYDSGTECFRIRNSWGFWGDAGEVWLPWDWVRLGVCGEAFAIRAVRCATAPRAA